MNEGGGSKTLRERQPPPVPERRRSNSNAAAFTVSNQTPSPSTIGSSSPINSNSPPSSAALMRSRSGPPVPTREHRLPRIQSLDMSEMEAELGMEGMEWASGGGGYGGNTKGGEDDEWEIVEMDEKGQVISTETTVVPRYREGHPQPPPHPLHLSAPPGSFSSQTITRPPVPGRSPPPSSAGSGGGIPTYNYNNDNFSKGSILDPSWKAALEAKLGTRVKIGSLVMDPKEKEKEKEKEREREREKEKEKGKEEKQKEKEKEKKPTKFMMRKKDSKPGSAALTKSKKKAGGSLIISDPGNAKHKVHVSFNYEWKGQDPAGEFRLISKLGQGAYGKVYKAEHKDTGFVLAIKCIPIPENVSSQTMREVENLKKEITILKNCRCPSIVSYFGVCFRHSTLWVMMELLEMGSIMDVLRETGLNHFIEADVAYIMKCAVPGLLYLHESNIIHRDLKGANILLTSDGHAKLADFGTSNYLRSGTQTVAGTPLFMSPELMNEESYNTKTDVWSLGITTLQIAEGKPPLYELNIGKAMMRIISGPPPSAREPHKWSREFNDFVSLCLQHDPKNRPETKDLLKHPFITNVDSRYEFSVLKKYRAIREKKKSEPSTMITQQMEALWPTGPVQQRLRREILNTDNAPPHSPSAPASTPSHSYVAQQPPFPLSSSSFLSSSDLTEGETNEGEGGDGYYLDEDAGFDAKLSTLDRKELEHLVKLLKVQWKKERESKKKWKRIVKEGSTVVDQTRKMN